jgi:hypothetical protein
MNKNVWWSRESATTITILSCFLHIAAFLWWCLCQLNNLYWVMYKSVGRKQDPVSPPKAPPHYSRCASAPTLIPESSNRRITLYLKAFKCSWQ